MTASTRHDAGDQPPKPERTLEVLSDEYARRILAALEERPMPAAALAEACDMSRPTVYRRLDRLERLGFVTSQVACDPDGHHRKRFHLALDEVRFEVDGEGVAGTVSLADSSVE